jgi:6-pyruvoyltetrahydropterin/6-carboxytetrahydropterin synthase
MWEVSKSFRFEAAHTLSGTTLGRAAEEVHGHSFRAEVAIEGTPDAATGMVVDLGRLEAAIADVKGMLDHKLLNRIEAIGPPTLENLARFICEQVRQVGPVTRVTVYRDSCGEACTYRPRQKRQGP